MPLVCACVLFELTSLCPHPAPPSPPYPTPITKVQNLLASHESLSFYVVSSFNMRNLANIVGRGGRLLPVLLLLLLLLLLLVASFLVSFLPSSSSLLAAVVLTCLLDCELLATFLSAWFSPARSRNIFSSRFLVSFILPCVWSRTFFFCF